MTIREKVGVALNSGSLKLSDIEEGAVDRVAALGYAHWLGRELFHLKYADQITVSRKQDVAIFVARRLARPKPPGELLLRVSYLALEAWLFDRCPVCHGRKFVGGDRQRIEAASAVRVCHRCNGTGKFVLRDHDVARVLGIPLTQVERWIPKLQRAQELLDHHDLRATRVVARQLRTG